MRKRINTLDASLLLNGISYGEHVMNPHSVIKEVDRVGPRQLECLYRAL